MMIKASLKHIAHQQEGYFSAAQAADAGYYKRLQYYHVECGDWLKVDRALYRLKGYPDTLESQFIRWTFLLTGRSRDRVVVVSHDSALHYYGLDEQRPDKIHLSVSSPKKMSVPTTCQLHWQQLPQRDYLKKNGFCIATPCRSLLDLRPDLLLRHRWNDTIRKAARKGLLSEQELEMLNERPTITLPTLRLDSGNDGPEQGARQFARTLANARGVAGSSMHPALREWGRISGRSFTLVEMLVVVAIISILAALLLPALNSAIGQARAAGCQNQLRQIASATYCYAGLNQDYFPSLVQSGSNYFWTQLLVKSGCMGDTLLIGVNLPPVFCCPERTTRIALRDRPSWALNQNLSFWGAGGASLKTTRVSQPSKIFLQVESLSADPAADWGFFMMSRSQLNYVYSGHAMGGHSSFVDGHTQRFSLEQMEEYSLSYPLRNPPWEP